MSDEDEHYNPKSHKNLLQAINSLGKTQHIRKTTRSEPWQQQDEFHLIKSKISSATIELEDDQPKKPVFANDIAKVLQTTKKHLTTGKQLRDVQQSKKVLKKPLEKPAAERIRRTIGYENVKKKLSRWDAVVAKNRSSEQQLFPLKGETIYIKTSASGPPLKLAVKSDLMVEMEQAEARLRAMKKASKGDFTDENEQLKREEQMLKKKLTRDELIARSREISYLKIRQSQQSAKARMKNKIKSKKYHKLLKRQKMQEQIKEFELLQKTNPEAAMEKLNEIEKSRVLERASLRHKNTGTWAKNLQVRAKYDKDVRKDLSEQLQISRQLTQKKEDSDEESSDDENTDQQKIDIVDGNATNDPFNPWLSSSKNQGNKENTRNLDEKSNWRQYWIERNKNQKLLQEYKESIEKDDNEMLTDSAELKSDETQEAIKKETTTKSKQSLKLKVKANKNKKNSKTLPDKSVKIRKQKVEKSVTKKLKNLKTAKKSKYENGWLVEEISPIETANKNIDDIFDEQESKIRQRLNKSLHIISNEAKNLKKLAKKQNNKKLKANIKKDELKNLKDLMFKDESKKPIIDDELNYEEPIPGNRELFKLKVKSESEDNMNANETNTTTTNANVSANYKNINATSKQSNSTTANIDPNQLITVKLKQKINAMDLNTEEDVDFDEMDESENRKSEQQMTISQAFEDDDIVADFSADKAKDSTLKDTEIDLSMPGWGSWAGPGLSQREKQQTSKTKRLVLKLAADEKRRDDNKNGLYINEEVSKQMRTHLVSDLPFPFTSLQDYEASIRAPIGREFVPETAFRMLTRPSVITLKGQVIEPMDESELIKPARRLTNVVDKRIKRLMAEENKK